MIKHEVKKLNRNFLKIAICLLILLVGIGAVSASDYNQDDDVQALENNGIEIVQGNDGALTDESASLVGENDGIASGEDGDLEAAEFVADEDGTSDAVDNDKIVVGEDDDSDEFEIVADGDACDALDASDDVEVISGEDCHVLGVEMGSSVISTSSGDDLMTTEPLDKYVGYGSKYKIIIRAPYKYIDTTLYKYGKLVYNEKYKVKYKINGKWTGWTKYGITSTAHHRYMVPDGAYVQKIKVKVKRW